jgi:hypothetical protein
VAEDALTGSTLLSVGLATHYHANYVAPYWAPSLRKNAVIGAHLFYRWPGRWGERDAFVRIYKGGEPDAQALKTIALTSKALVQATPEPAAGVAVPATVDANLELQRARLTLGPKHPKLIELEKRARSGGSSEGAGSSERLAAVLKELGIARRTLGPKHPQIIALEERRAALTRSR